MQIINGVECRTREESLRHIAQQAKLKKVGPKTEREACGCEYQYPSGNNCAVGSLFNKAQLKTIKKAGLNEMAIDYVARDYVGQKNIETVTGMEMKELKKLQELHDGVVQDRSPQAARDALIRYCETELEKLEKAVSQ